MSDIQNSNQISASAETVVRVLQQRLADEIQRTTVLEAAVFERDVKIAELSRKIAEMEGGSHAPLAAVPDLSPQPNTR